MYNLNILGQIVWELDLGLPAVAMYLLQNDGLHKLAFTVLGKETMENLVKVCSFFNKKCKSAFNRILHLMIITMRKNEVEIAKDPTLNTLCSFDS